MGYPANRVKQAPEEEKSLERVIKPEISYFAEF
jgi:hypothetical protein